MHRAPACYASFLPDSWLWIRHHGSEKQRLNKSRSLATTFPPVSFIFKHFCLLPANWSRVIIGCIHIQIFLSSEYLKWLPCCRSLCCGPAVACRLGEQQLRGVLTSEISWRAEWAVCSEFGLVRLDFFWLTSRSPLNKMSVFDCGERFYLFCDPDGSFFYLRSPFWLTHRLFSIACRNQL